MADARMLGAVAPSWCPYCHTPAGVDCPDAQRSGKQVRQAERRQVRREVTQQINERQEES